MNVRAEIPVQNGTTVLRPKLESLFPFKILAMLLDDIDKKAAIFSLLD
jgi:hypothetical protein